MVEWIQYSEVDSVVEFIKCGRVKYNIVEWIE